MKKYRIIRRNSLYGWEYFIQHKILGILWANIDSWDQAYNKFDLGMVKEKLQNIQSKEIEYKNRKKQGNCVIL